MNAKRRDVLNSQKTRTLMTKFEWRFPGLCLEAALACAGMTLGGTKDGPAQSDPAPTAAIQTSRAGGILECLVG